MDELFVCKTKYDYGMYVRLNKIARKKPLIIFISVFCLVIAFLVGLQFYKYISHGLSVPVRLYINSIFLILLIIYLFIGPYITALFSQRIYKGVYDNADITVYSGSIKVDYGSNVLNIDMQQTIIYWFDDDEYFFLSKNKNGKTGCYIMQKNGFQKGSADEFRTFLETNSQFIRENKT